MISTDYYISVFVWLGLIIMQVINLYGLWTIQIALKKNTIYQCSSLLKSHL